MSDSTVAREPLPGAMRIARVALWYTVVPATAMLLFLPPPSSGTGRERGAWLMLAAFITGSVAAAILITRRRRAGWAITIGLGLLTLSNIVTSDIVPQMRYGTLAANPAIPLSFSIAGSAYVGWLVALGCCLSVHKWPTPQVADSK